MLALLGGTWSGSCGLIEYYMPALLDGTRSASKMVVAVMGWSSITCSVSLGKGKDGMACTM
jgi:hypothetical protein